MEIKVWEVFCRVFPKGRLSWTWPRHTCIPGSMQPTIHQREETTLDDFWKAKPQFTLNAQVRVIDEGLPMAEQMDSSSFRCRNIALEIFTISTYDIILWLSLELGFLYQLYQRGGAVFPSPASHGESQTNLGIGKPIFWRGIPLVLTICLFEKFIDAFENGIPVTWTHRFGLMVYLEGFFGYTILKQQTTTGIVVCLELFETELKNPEITTKKNSWTTHRSEYIWSFINYWNIWKSSDLFLMSVLSKDTSKPQMKLLEIEIPGLTSNFAG